MIGSGEAANLEQSTSDVRQMAYDFTARVVADLKNTFVAQASLSSQAAITADDLYFQYDVLAQSKSADPRDRGFARALATIGLESSETTENDKRLLAKVVPSTDSNFRRINKEHNVFVEDNLRLAA